MSAKLGTVDKTAGEARCDTHLTARALRPEQHLSGLRRAAAALLLLSGLLALPASAAAAEPTRSDEWTGTGDLPADALEVCTAEAADAVTRGGGWQYRVGRSVLQAGVLRAAHFHRYDDCAVVIATTRQRHGDGWLPLSRLVWVSTDPLDRARYGWRLVYGTTPGVRDPIRPTGPTAPPLITVSDCTGWNQHPLTLDSNSRYTGSGTLHISKALASTLPLSYDGNGRPRANNHGTSNGILFFQVGNIRYGPALIQSAFIADRPTPRANDVAFIFDTGLPGVTRVTFNVGSC